MCDCSGVDDINLHILFFDIMDNEREKYKENEKIFHNYVSEI